MWLAVDIRRILCPVDFSEPSRAALRAAACFARQFKAQLQVVFVEDPLLASVAAQVAPQAADATAEAARFVAETGDDVLASARIVVETDRDVASRIVTLASREQADLIVMGAHGLTGIRKAFFGSTTARVLKSTATSLLIVPPTGSADMACDLEGLGPILVLTDFGPAAAYAAAAAASLAKAVDAPLVLVHVLPELSMPLSWRSRGDDLTQQRLDEAHRRMAQAIVPLQAVTPIESTIVQGNIAEVAADLARKRHAGLIVMGVESGARGMRPGATAYPVICAAPVPVLAIPAPGD